MKMKRTVIMRNNSTKAHRVWVVFSGKTEIFWLRFLKKGFRHCYVIMHDGRKWISYDPLSPHTEIIVHHDLSEDFDLPQWLATQGQLPVPASMNWQVLKPAPIMVFSCVEAIKRILGIHRRFVVTPWQLYRHLVCAAS